MPRDQPILYVAIRGGLGNQMLQYATGKSLARRLGCDFVLDCSHYANQSPRTTRRAYQLDVFQQSAQALWGESTGLAAWPPVKLLKRFWLTKPLFRPPGAGGLGVPSYFEPHMRFDPNLADVRPPVVIRGFWHSHRYF